MTDASPAAGSRVRQVSPEYEGTEVYHSLYLPTDWKPGGNYPILVEYTGNKFPPANGSGEVKDANLGYGLSGGAGFIWVTMPYIEKGRIKNAVRWWGDREATLEYCKRNLPRIAKQFGGDLSNVIVCGFSRGAIATSYLGLADDEIALFWKGLFAHDHFDGDREWGYPECDRASALVRIKRLGGRPVFVSWENKGASRLKETFLGKHADLGAFTFQDLPVHQIFSIPEAPYVHSHTDLWMHRESPQRETAREWLRALVDSPPFYRVLYKSALPDPVKIPYPSALSMCLCENSTGERRLIALSAIENRKVLPEFETLEPGNFVQLSTVPWSERSKAARAMGILNDFKDEFDLPLLHGTRYRNTPETE